MTSSRSAAKPRGSQISIAEKPTATISIQKGRMSTDPAPGSQKRSILVLYASETGNAQDVAEELGDLAERLHFVTQVSEMNNFKPETLALHTFTIFVASTTGQGDIPGNGGLFWKSLLLKRLTSTFLEGVNFASFGLGDSSYPKFNWASRKLHKRLIQLGANEIYPCGEADQRHPEGLEGTFIPWVLSFRKHLLDRYPLPEGKDPIPDDVKLPPKWLLQSEGAADIPAEPSIPGNKEPQTAPNEQPGLRRLDHDVRPLPDTLKATLTKNKRVTPQKHWQDVRHIALTVPESLSYSPGDMICVTPKNFDSDVQHLIEMMGWEEQADKLVTLIPGESLQALDVIPSPPIVNLENYPQLTLRALVTDYLDVRAIPRRSFFSAIAHYTPDETHKERLLEFIVPEYLDEFWDYTSRPRRSILEVLQEFHSVRVPWQHALSVFPIFRGRQFSIASGGPLKRLPDGSTQFELLIAIVKYQTVIKRIREGVCTRYLSVLRPGSTLRVQLQRGGLHSSIPQLTGPTVLVGPGTGIAPLRSMIWEKAGLVQAFRQKHSGVQPPIGPTILLYGGRNRAADYFFEEDWEELKDEIDLTVLTAFSRDQRHKIYVQDLVREDFGLFYDLLRNRNGSVYICGSSGRMPQAIREALIETFEHGKGTGEWNRQAAEEYLLGMERSGRYKQETW